MNPLFSLRLLLLALILPCTLLAQEKPQLWTLPSNDSFLPLIPPPPAAGSMAEKADLDSIIGAQDHPTAAEIAHAQKSVTYNVFTYAEVLGPDFNPTTHPKTAAFFKRLDATVNVPKDFLKVTFHRERPYKTFPGQVKELVTEEGGYAYPSGHSTRSWLGALVMGTLDPVHRSAYLSSALQVCQDRIVGGMHYPDDTLEGRVLAEAVYADLMQNQTFKHDLEELKAAEFPSVSK
jgi:acid phosphatase (class A)